MSKSVFYADLDIINEKGVLVTGHGKGLVSKNPIINGQYVANDMVRLTVKNGDLFGYQGYVEQKNNELIKIDYLLYFFAASESNQPSQPTIITIADYLALSKHNIDSGEQLNQTLNPTSQNPGNAYKEYVQILRQVNNAKFISVPFTEDADDRATFVHTLIK
ncbi:TPA: hypothetical protein ACG05V_005928 [Bacillus pacificus]|uniref:hypothetical protein n=1 Tax=Bacillus cereus group TaxID=86661 RepID=UPI00027CCC39|nr:hypothetical protein [Bacillus cereus group sp. Bc002]AFQ09219.1 hypothetical protein BCK_06560 [Bacillus cereus FRI-35]MDA2783075.1 hypothetical protein [Bacillus cereus group sp. Bc002]HDR7254855.1 hypothetical protein [Bacillus pacificus]HDR7742916.1 hypothetical protein [Bacillus pacificus]